MNRFLRNALCAMSLLACTALAADPTTTTAATTTAMPATGPAVSMQAKMFTKDQLATALQSVVDKINACNGDTTCLKDVKTWNEAAMASVKSQAINFKAGQVLQLELLCGTDKTPQTSNQTVTVTAASTFMLTPPAAQCMVKGIDPKCGAIERGKHYPDVKAGETLYCVMGDDTKLKQATDNLKSAVLNSMKKVMQNQIQQKAQASTPAVTTAPASAVTPAPAAAPATTPAVTAPAATPAPVTTPAPAKTPAPAAAATVSTNA